MTSERWQQVKAILQAALDRSVEERSDYLDCVCGADALLRREVESLLAADARAGDAVERAAAVFLGDLVPMAYPTLRQRIGAYRLVRELGNGGMGTVFLAARADGAFIKQVAVKIVSRACASPDVVRRFQSERQILADLDHPNIARLLDGGTTNEGLPYFVMEYIEGEAITKYCDGHSLCTMDRLKLFCDVCDAVRYAHGHGVVHRDIKPSNLLVTPQGVPKLLDFGIAKILNSARWPNGESHLTVGLFTPDYASPEQIRGEACGVTSDVYSLGVLLYELLTGHSPYRIDWARPNALARAICEDRPARPSTVVRRFKEIPSPAGPGVGTLGPEDISRTREGRREQRRRRLAGDLDHILLMALRKESTRRYPSVEAFSQDIKRHLDGLPVQARGDSITYRTRTLLMRHRIGALAVALTTGLLMLWFQGGLPGRRGAPLATSHRQLTFTGHASAPALSPHGDFVTYVNDQELLVQAISGGRPIRVATGQLFGPRWTADGTRILYRRFGVDPSEAGIFVVPRGGGTARKLAGPAVYFALSTDGRSLLAGGASMLSIRDLDTGHTRDLTDTLFNESGYVLLMEAEPSPRNNWIALGGIGKDETKFLALLAPDGSLVKTVLEGHDNLTSPRWNASGAALYYIRSKDNTPELMKATIDSRSGAWRGSTVLLSGLPLGRSFGVSWDGRKLAYPRLNVRSHVWLADIKGGTAQATLQTRPLTSGTQEYRDPAISPDGKWVAFSAGVTPTYNLFIMPLSGKGTQQLTSGEGESSGPSWSPDGRHIAFGSFASGRPVVMIQAVTGGQARICSHRPFNRSTAIRSTIAWSPDGTRLLYQLAGNRNFGVIDLPTDTETDLVSNESGGAIFDPVFSPDGTKVAVFWSRKDSGLWLISLQDHSQTLLVKTSIQRPLAWSADGNAIFYATRNNEGFAFQRIWSVPASGGSPHVVVDLPPNVRSLAMTPDAGHFVYQVVETVSDIWLAENFDPEVR